MARAVATPVFLQLAAILAGFLPITRGFAVIAAAHVLTHFLPVTLHFAPIAVHFMAGVRIGGDRYERGDQR